MKKGLRGLIYIVLAFVILGFFGNYFFVFDLFSHFYLQFFVVISVLLFIYVCCRHWRESLIAVCLGIFLFSHLIAADFSGIWKDSTISRPDIFYMNAYYWNDNITRISDNITKVDPKQIIMVELNEKLFEKVKATGHFKYNYYYPDNAESFGFFSNENILEQRIYKSAGYPIGYFRTEKMTYYVVHPYPPMDGETYKDQKIFFTAVSKLLSEEKNDFVVIGDFNSTAYSQVFQSHFGKYFYKPVYSWWVDTILTIPIDYTISNKKLEVHPWDILSSDHIPLLIHF